MITKTEFTYDIDKIHSAYNSITHLSWFKNQIAVKSRPGAENQLTDGIGFRIDLEPYPVMNDIFKGTYFEELTEKLSFKYNRVRLMKIPPQTCYSIHADLEYRYHIPIITDPACLMLDFEANKTYHIPQDGYIYKLDGLRPHSAMNLTSNITRIHLVFVEHVGI